MDRQKIIDKICKCLRLSESCNPNEAASALRQAHGLMKKYNVTEDQILGADVSEAAVESVSRYNPPYWVLALSNIVAQAFECRVFVSRRFGRRPEFRFIGMQLSPEVASYTFTVLYRQLKQARRDFCYGLDIEDRVEKDRRTDVFAQAWLFRVANLVADFVATPTARDRIDRYVTENYGDIPDLVEAPIHAEVRDYDDILSGMKAADEVALYRSMDRALVPRLQVARKQA
ncbi:MAG: DUF2786 domain-containing protein [Thioalkalispiraceae bacterium]|jgi:hypothetical protein